VGKYSNKNIYYYSSVQIKKENGIWVATTLSFETFFSQIGQFHETFSTFDFNCHVFLFFPQGLNNAGHPLLVLYFRVKFYVDSHLLIRYVVTFLNERIQPIYGNDDDDDDDFFFVCVCVLCYLNYLAGIE
jgi:hypothetical protein